MCRKTSRYPVLTAVMALVYLAAGIAAAATVTQSITYEGKLTDAAGNPLTGTYPVKFSLYGVSTGGTALATSTQSVSCANGLFITPVAFNPGVADGRALWLGITVGTDDEMTPRQEIRPVPYAMSLRPGAGMVGTDLYPVLNLLSRGGGIALNISTTGASSGGVYATTAGEYSQGVSAYTRGFSSYGLKALTAGQYSPGVYSYTTGQNSEGIWISTTNQSSAGVFARTFGQSSPGFSVSTTGPDSEGLVATTSGQYSNGLDVSTQGYGSNGLSSRTTGQYSDGLSASTQGQNSNGITASTTGQYSYGIHSSTSGPASHGVHASTTGPSSYGVYSYTAGQDSYGVLAYTTNQSSIGVRATTLGANSNGITVSTGGQNSDGVSATTSGQFSNGFLASTSAYGSVGFVAFTTGEYSEGVGVSTSGQNSNGIYSSTSGYNSQGLVAQATGQYGNGVTAYSSQANAIYADTTSPSGYGLKTPDYIYAAGSKYPAVDVAEYFPVEEGSGPGTVMVIGPAGTLLPSSASYDTRVAGIVSTDPAVSLGAKDTGNPGEAPIAVAGRVPCKVDAGYGAIHPGDLLSTSDTPGHAMKAVPTVIDGRGFYPDGTILGKAIGTLESGTGTIGVLVTLQ